MKVETGTVTILRISEVPRLDPIRVTLDNGELGKGRITIECYSKAWSAYWGAMSDRTVEQFFVDCGNDYLIGNLSPGLYPISPIGETLEKDAKRVIRHRRKGIGEWRDMPLTDEAAMELMDRASALGHCNGESSAWENSSLLIDIYGQDWYRIAKCEGPNHEYKYLERICDAVREALKTQAAAKEGAQQG